MAWIVDRSTVSWALFRQTSLVSSQSLVSLRQPHAVAVNLGDYEGSGLAELALGIVDDYEVTLYLYAIDELAVDATLPMTHQKTLLIAEAPWWETAHYKYVNNHPTTPRHHDTTTPRWNTACGWCRAT